MVTLANTQNFNEFELHFRAILGIPIPKIKLLQAGVSAVILGKEHGENPVFEGIEEVLAQPNSDIKVFGKQVIRPYRRMAVALSYDKLGCDMNALIEKTKLMAKAVKVD